MFRKIIIKNLRKPKGIFGRRVSKMLENNLGEYAEMRQYLDLWKGMKLLEIGYGPGLGINDILKHNPGILVEGIDFSKLMYKTALKNTRDYRASVRLYHGDFNTRNFSGASFDRVLLMNVIYFWNDPENSLGKIKSLLNPGGKVVIGMASPELLKPRMPEGQKVFHYHSIEGVKNILEGHSLKVDVHEFSLEKGCFFVVGRMI